MKKCITISGGFDSGCLPFLIKNVQEYDFVFFDYNQLYLKKEMQKAIQFSKKFNKQLKIIKLPKLEHDQERRNFIFMAELKKRSYKKVVVGNRNIFPIFDKYKDSNYLYLKLIAFLFNMKIKLPVTGWSKKKIIRFLNKKNFSDFYNCYNNLDDIYTCDCVNCKELRRLI